MDADVCVSSPWSKSDCIRPALHPAYLRCSSLKYSRYPHSSRLAIRAHRRPRCDAGLSPRADKPADVATISELFDLAGRVAIVTGGSRGLGQEMAEGLAEA